MKIGLGLGLCQMCHSSR